MTNNFNDVESIQTQIDDTIDRIDAFIDEIEAEDLERYPNFEERLGQLTQSIESAEEAIMSIVDQRLSKDAVELENLIEVTEDAIETLNLKLSQNKKSAFVVALNALLDLQNMLQELNLGDDSSLRRMK